MAPSLRDSGILVWGSNPTLKRGANNHCAYGAVPPACYEAAQKMIGTGMNMKRKLACVLICAIFVAQIASTQSKVKKPSAEPSDFYPDDRNRGFDDAGAPSDAVLDSLLKTPEAKLNWDRLQKLNREELRKLFLVVRVHLKDAGETDEVVLEKDPMSGADCDWFWFVRDLGGHAQVLLFENAYGVYLLESRTNGYRDIRSVAFAGGTTYTNIFHYNGQRYIPVHKYQKEIRP